MARINIVVGSDAGSTIQLVDVAEPLLRANAAVLAGAIGKDDNVAACRLSRLRIPATWRINGSGHAVSPYNYIDPAEPDPTRVS